jgi:hypothetical protein
MYCLRLSLQKNHDDFRVVRFYLVSGFVDRAHVYIVEPCIEVICMGN